MVSLSCCALTEVIDSLRIRAEGVVGLEPDMSSTRQYVVFAVCGLQQQLRSE
jgi:hypothetical protein